MHHFIVILNLVSLLEGNLDIPPLVRLSLKIENTPQSSHFNTDCQWLTSGFRGTFFRGNPTSLYGENDGFRAPSLEKIPINNVYVFLYVLQKKI